MYKIRSRASSSSSGSLKLKQENQIECQLRHRLAPKDLFEQLIEQNEHPQQEVNQMVLQTIQRLNLSPRHFHQHLHPHQHDHHQSNHLQLELTHHQGCKCTKIDCLKMYCECFAKGKICTASCYCVCCNNKIENQNEIYKARQIANFRHPGTFKGIPAFVPLKRCTCKKSECKKNYCECFRAGLKCTEECECLVCQNGKPHMHEEYFDSRMEIQINA